MGIFGGVVINGPSSANWDIDLGSYIVNDWYYQSAFTVSAEADANLQAGQGPPPSDNILINGTNKNANGGGTYGTVPNLQKGKKYRLRLVNSALDSAIRVSLDNHPFTVMSADMVPIKPYNTDWVLLGIGEISFTSYVRFES